MGVMSCIKLTNSNLYDCIPHHLIHYHNIPDPKFKITLMRLSDSKMVLLKGVWRAKRTSLTSKQALLLILYVSQNLSFPVFLIKASQNRQSR